MKKRQKRKTHINTISVRFFTGYEKMLEDPELGTIDVYLFKRRNATNS